MKDKIAIIAGHSRSAHGALCYDGSYEHDHTHTLQKMIISLQAETAMYQGSSMQPATDHEALNLRSVVNLINNNKQLSHGIDLHFNNNNPHASGVEVIVHPRTSTENKERASRIVKGVSQILNLPHRKRVASRDYIYPDETPRKTLAIIDQTIIPMILLEICFLNSNDLPIYIEKKADVAHFVANEIF